MSTNSSREVLNTEPAFLISLFNFLVSLALMQLPHQMVIDMQHLVGFIKGPKLPQHVESAPSFFDSLSVAFPVQSVVKVNPGICISLLPGWK